MSEVSRGGGAFAKVVQKTLVRTRTKVLQRVGKAEKTTDEALKDNITAFQKQQATALRLQKEMKHYISCVKAMSLAAKSLYSVLKDTYEEDWYDPHTVHGSLNSLELMQTNYEAELAERVHTDLNGYIDQFPVYKEKMNKRNRKRLDYDNAKHAYESLYGAKKPDHTKISKAHESLEGARRLFDEINSDLHRELPRFYENRVEFVANNLIKLFTAEATFHTNTGKLNDQLTDLLQTLTTTHKEEMARLNESPRKKANVSRNDDDDPDTLDLPSISPDVRSPMKSNGHSGDMATPKLTTPKSISASAQQPRNSQQFHSTDETEIRKAPPPARPPTGPQSPITCAPKEGNPFLSDDDETLHSEIPENDKSQLQISDSAECPSENLSDQNLAPGASVETEGPGNPFDEDEDDDDGPGVTEEDKDESASETVVPVAVEPVVIISDQGLSSTPASTPRSESKPSTSSSSYNSPPPLPDSVLYQVMATHPYIAEDEDELSFEAGEIINVVQFDNEEEQDDGWLMGININTQAKGVFPANFTQRIARKT